MPVPATINDISTTAGSNSPSGSETPTDGDNHIRSAYSFIAQLRDKLNGTSVATLDDPAFSGTASGSLAGLALVSPLLSGGIDFTNSAVADATTLDWYEEGTYTPTLAFGGASVGMAYSEQVGKFTRVGNVVTFLVRLQLSNRGSSTGNAAITNALPYAPAYGDIPFLAETTGFNGINGLYASTGSASTSLFPRYPTSTNPTIPTETNFSNTSLVVIGGSYLV